MTIAKALLLFGLSLSAASTLAGTPEDMARQWCVDCHTANGNSMSPLFPLLAGQKAPYMVQQLKAFREKSRENPSAQDYMWGMSGHLDDATIEGLAAYFAAQTPRPNPSDASPALRKAGEQIYQNGIAATGTPACAACHGAGAAGTDIAPRLAGQHASYLNQQLHVFYTNQRPAAVAMHAIIKSLNDHDIDALSAYLQNLP